MHSGRPISRAKMFRFTLFVLGNALHHGLWQRCSSGSGCSHLPRSAVSRDAWDVLSPGFWRRTAVSRFTASTHGVRMAYRTAYAIHCIGWMPNGWSAPAAAALAPHVLTRRGAISVDTCHLCRRTISAHECHLCTRVPSLCKRVICIYTLSLYKRTEWVRARARG